MSEAQIKCVAAAHGLAAKGNKGALIDKLEGQLMIGMGQTKRRLIQDKPTAGKRRRKANSDSDEDWSG